MDGSREQYDEDPERFIRDHVLLHFESEFWEDDFDLKQELFGYYHNLPDVHHPLLSKQGESRWPPDCEGRVGEARVSIPRVMKMVEEGSIDGYKFGGKLLITQSSVEQRLRYIEERRQAHARKSTGGQEDAQREVLGVFRRAELGGDVNDCYDERDDSRVLQGRRNGLQRGDAFAS